MKTYQTLFSFVLLFFILSCEKKADEKNVFPSSEPLKIISFSPTQGEVGTKVVIIGTGFSINSLSNTIKFGDKAAVIDSSSNTRLIVRVPKDVVSGKITIESGGKLVSSGIDFIVNQTPPQFPQMGTNSDGTPKEVNIPDSVSTVSATISTIIDKEGSRSIIQHGHIWSSTKANPTINGRLVNTEGITELGKIPENVNFPYVFKSKLTNLEPSTTYNIRAYVTTKDGTTYGPVSSVSSKKTCVLKSFVAPFATYSFNYDTKFQLIEMEDAIQKAFFTYDSQGYLIRFESRRDGVTETETYKYNSSGLLSEKANEKKFASFTLNSSSSYTYDNAGILTKESIRSGNSSTSTDYIFTNGILTSVVTGEKDIKYTIKNGNIVQYESNLALNNYEYDSQGNLIKNEQIEKSTNKKSIFSFKYDNAPNFKFSIYGNLKGWNSFTIKKATFFALTNINTSNSNNNLIENIYQYENSNGLLVINTNTYDYSYLNGRTTSFKSQFRQTTDGKISSSLPLSTIYLNYTGDCFK